MNSESLNKQLAPSVAATGTRHERLHGPDVLRGFAAVGVVMFHVYFLSGAPRLPWVGFFVGRLDFFVRLFFALSAFAIVFAYSRRLDSVEKIRTFYIKRYFRLAPLFYFVMVCGALLTLWQKRSHASLLDYLLSATFTFSFVPGKNGSLVGGGWSLGLEWLFYIAFPFLLVLAGNFRSAFVLWVVSVIIACASAGHFASLGDVAVMKNYGLLYFLAHLPFFAAGIACYHLFAAVRGRGYSIGTFPAGCIVVLVMAVTLVYFFRGWTSVVPEELFLSVIAFLLVLVSAFGLPRWLDNELTRYLGKISYSLYLMQFILFGLFDGIGVFQWICGLPIGPLMMFVACVSTMLVTVFAVSAATYRFVELPGMRFADRHMPLLHRMLGGNNSASQRRTNVPEANP